MLPGSLSDTYKNNLRVKHELTKHLTESCGLGSHEHSLYEGLSEKSSGLHDLAKIECYQRALHLCSYLPYSGTSQVHSLTVTKIIR